MTSSSGILTEFVDGILRVTISRPERMNALDGAASRELIRVLAEDACGEGVRAVILTGEGNAFCTGADIAEVAEVGPRSPEEADEAAQQTMDTANAMVRAIVELPVPVIAAVNGPAVGVGASIALASDLVYASSDAYLLLAFTNIGLMPDGGASLLVAASAGRARANAMAFLGEKIEASVALDMGLINGVHGSSELHEHASKVARRFARGPKRALELTKGAMNATTLALLDAALSRESEGQRELIQSPDFATGIAAVLSGTRPKFE